MSLILQVCINPYLHYVSLSFCIFILEYGEQNADVTKEYEFLMNFMTLDMSIRNEIGHQFEEFIQGCTFRGADCLNSRYINTNLR